MALAIAVQNGWPLYNFDVKQAFVQAKLDTDVCMKFPYGCGEGAGKVVKLDRAPYRINQAGRQQSAVLCQTLEDEHGMEQCRADPCVYRKTVEGVVELILVVHVDDILVSGKKEACDELHHTLNENFPTENLGELKWHLGCAVERDWQQAKVTIKQPAMIDTLINRSNVTPQSDTLASTVTDLEPTTVDDTVVDRPFRQAVGGVMWLAGMTRPDIANAARAVARHSHNPCERHWKAAMKAFANLNSTRNQGITYTKGEELSLSVYTDADYAIKETDRRSISGVGVMLGNTAVYATSRKQHCVALPTTEAEYVALPEGAKEGMFVISVISSMQPGVYEITLMEDNEGSKAMAENPLSPGRSKHIDVRWHFIRKLIGRRK